MFFRQRFGPLSIRTYAAVFIAVVALLFGVISWAMLYKITTAQGEVERSNQRDAALEISQSLTQLLKEAERVGRTLIAWDETHQQLSDPSYYVYWRDNRALDGVAMPAYVNAVELYNRQGHPLASVRLANMPPAIAGETRSVVVKQGGRDYLYLTLPIQDGESLSVITGYAVLKLDFLGALQNVQHFRYADPHSIALSLRQGESVAADQLNRYVTFNALNNETMNGLLKIMAQSQYRMVFIGLSMALLLYMALSALVAKPLQRLSQHIDTLREGGGGLMLDSLGSGLTVMELEKVRSSLNDYQNQLEAMHASLDQKNTELWTMAHRDPLTGVFNRRCFDEDWQLVSTVAAGRRVDVSFMLFDCDHFKPINDTYGHLVGDQVLQVIAQELQKILRSGDRLYRFGGDEFATMFLDVDPNHALEVAQRCVEAVDRHNFFSLGVKEPVRISVGIAHASGTRMEDLATLQKQADVAMYHAKRPGYAKTVVYAEDMANKGDAVFSNQITNAVFEAIASGAALEMHYQPVVDLATGKVDYYEALVRIRLEQELILPRAIFPVVEGRRLEAEFDFAVMGCILENLAAGVIPRGSGVSVNISGPAVVHPKINEKLAEFEPYLKDYKLVVEITETALITQLQQASVNLNKLRTAGFVVALDDFGSGYSSLGYLDSMPVDVVKFDVSMIRSLDQGGRHGGIVEGLAQMILKAGYHIVAEGIETRQTLETVSRLGFSHGQGYLLGRPEAKSG